MSEGYRSDRVMSWLNPGADPQGSGYQARQARFALANGGVFGDGLGQGTAKWNYLPNAHNDFIFAIIGEELGFVGAAGLLCLFGLFAYTGMRIARRSADPFLRLLTATATHVGARAGVHQRRLRHRAAAGDRAAAAADLRGRNINGDNASDHRRDRQRGATRTRGGGRAARRSRRPGEQAAAAAPARAVRADPHRGAARPVAVTPGEAGRPRRRASPAKDNRRKPHAADRPVRRSGHHGGGQRASRATGQRHQGRRARTLEGQRHG